MLVEALGLMQGLGQLQTWQVGRQASGFGTQTRWRIANPGTPLYVNLATGSTLAQGAANAQLQAQLGSQAVPFASLEEALSVLAAPPSAAAWSTPRNIYLGPGVYTVGAAIIRRPLNFIFDPGAAISDIVMIESSTDAAIDHGAVGPCTVGFYGLPHGPGVSQLLGGIQVDQRGTSVRAVILRIEGMVGNLVNIGAGVNGGLFVEDGGAELHAPALAFTLEVRDAEIEGASLECESVLSVGGIIRPTAVTCVGVVESRLYSTRLDSPGVWTGGTLRIDGSTNFDWVNPPHGPWVKAAPGGVAPLPMV